MPSILSRTTSRPAPDPGPPSCGSAAMLLTTVTSWPRSTSLRASSSERVAVALSRVAKY